MGPVPSIRSVRYPRGATVLWRWTDCPEDHRVATFVAAFTGARGSVQVRTRAGLDAEDIETIIGYARRCALAAVRSQDPGRVAEAFDALSTIDTARADSHDLAFAVLALASAASCLGVPVASSAAGAMRRADPRVVRMLTSAALRPARSSGYRPVRVAGGPVLVFDARPADQPECDLVPLALGLASAFEDEGTYRVDEVSIDVSVPPGWVGERLDRRARALTGEVTACVSLRGAPVERPRDHMLLVYVARSPTAAGAAALAEGASCRTSSHSTVLALADGHLSAIVIVKSMRAGQRAYEGIERMARFRPLVTPLIHNPPAPP